MKKPTKAQIEVLKEIEALLYYQQKLTEVKKDYKLLNDKVENFISQFDEDGDK